MEKLPDARRRRRQKQTWMWMGICGFVGLANLYVYVAVLPWSLNLCLGLGFLAIPLGYLGLRFSWEWVQAEWSQGSWTKRSDHEGELVVGRVADRRRREMRWHRRQREAPTLILGPTRSGKTTLAGHWIGQDILRGETAVIVDPHRDLALQLLAPCQQAGRDAMWFEPGDPERVPGYNPLEVRDGWTPLARAKMVTEATRRLWFPYQGEVPARLSHTLLHAAHLLAATGYTLVELPRLLRQEAFRNSLAEHIQDPGLRDWLGWFNALTAHQRYEQVTSTLIRITELVHDPAVAIVLGQQHGTIAVSEAIDQNRVLLAALTSARLQSAAYLLGGLLTTDLIYALMQRLTRPFEERRRVYVLLDEFHELMPESAKDFISQVGKCGCSLTLIGQARGMIDSRLRSTVLANCSNRVFFRAVGPEGLEIAREVFEPDPSLVKHMGEDLRPTFYTPQEQWAFHAARLQALPPHTYVVVTADKADPQYLRQPPTQRLPDHELEALRKEMLPRYTRPRQEVEAELEERRRSLDRRFGPLAEGLPPAPGEDEPERPREHAPF